MEWSLDPPQTGTVTDVMETIISLIETHQLSIFSKYLYMPFCNLQVFRGKVHRTSHQNQQHARTGTFFQPVVQSRSTFL